MSAASFVCPNAILRAGPCCLQYTAVPQMDGAPLRAITVKDAIGDLPPIVNGSDMLEMPYSGACPPTLPHSLQACHSTATCIEDTCVQNWLTSAAPEGLACGG